MRVWRKLTALVLCAACVCALICVSPAQAAGTAVSTFPDITDPQLGRAVEALRTMGVIDGSGGQYRPDDSLTRAQFCKMALLVMGKGDEADAQSSRTIFTDVPGKHWARGYVNLAATTTVGGEEDKGGYRLMMGMGDGSFAPDRAITYAEAVTSMLRVLGYTREAALNWPQGAVAAASSVGLDSGFTPPRAGDPLTRAQAALLFCNVLTAPVSGEKDSTYLESLGYDVKKGALLLDGSATVNGRPGYVRVFSRDSDQEQSAVLPAVNTPASFLEGARGTAVYQKGKLLTFLPDAGSASRTITVASASNGVLTATDGTRFSPSGTTEVWEGDSKEDYASRFTFLQPGTSITVCFTDGGAIDYLFVHGTSATLTGGVMVAWDEVSGNPFAQLTAGTVDYKIMKNGSEVSTSALRRYDVAAFDPSNKTLYVTDFRLTGVYEAAYPNTTLPTKVRLSLLGGDLEVLDSAVKDLKGLKLGSSVTLLLTPDCKVAGAVSSSTLRSNTVGYVDSSGKVQLLNAPAGLPALSSKLGAEVDRYRDCLVRVTGGEDATVYLSRLSGRTPTKPLDLENRTLGGAPLAENVAVFDRIAGSGIKRIALTDIAMDRVPAERIAYQRTNSDGKVDLLLLENATGDLLTYGIASVETVSNQDPSDEEDGGSVTVINTYTTVSNSRGKDLIKVVGGTKYRDRQFIGLAASVDKLDGTARSAGSVALKSVEKVNPTNFNLNTGIFFSGSMQLPVSDDVQCYNAETRTWFGAGYEDLTPMDNLRACLAYSSNLTVWYDRAPDQGGKVRIVVANAG